MFHAGLPFKPFVLLGSPALLASVFPLCLADEVLDLGSVAFAFGRAHARRVLGDLLRGLFHLLAQLGAARLGPGIEVGHSGDLNELLLRVFEARDRIALPCFRLPLLALFLLFPLRPPFLLLLLPLRWTLLLRGLG